MNSVVKTRARAKNVKDTAVWVTHQERNYLQMGIKQPGGKLPLFDGYGQEFDSVLIKSCMEKGLVERWFANPLKPDWLVCRLTEKGRKALR